MIDYLIVIYRNYDLLELQVENFKKRLQPSDYRLIIVDNTPDSEKKSIQCANLIDCQVVTLESKPTFDGVSHGRAIDYGLQYCTSNIVAIIDSDFFILNHNITSYIKNKFDQGYEAVGCEYNDGDGTKGVVNRNPKLFENIPCCFGAYYRYELARSASWVVTQQEVNDNLNTGFVEVGFKIRKYILENNVKTLNWKNDATSYGPGFFKNENNETMGVHYVGGSHRRWNSTSKETLKNIIKQDYV